MGNLKSKEYLTCLLFGVLMATMPSFIAWFQTGSPFWVLKADELFPMFISSQSFHNHPFIIDKLSFYPSFLLVPWVLISKIFDSPFFIPFVWRIFAGISISTGLFLFFTRLMNSQRKALWISLFCLLDPGVRKGFPLLDLFKYSFNAFAPGESAGIIFRQWRFITPGLSYFYLLLFLYFLLGITKSLNTSKKDIVFTGVSLGLLFYAYFYFWTSSFAALFLLALYLKEKRMDLFKPWG